MLDDVEIRVERVENGLQGGILVAFEEFAGEGKHKRYLEVDLGRIDAIKGAIEFSGGKSAVDTGIHAGLVSEDVVRWGER